MGQQSKPLEEAESGVLGLFAELGLTSLCQWDVLVFVARHDVALLSVPRIAELLGYPRDDVERALASLVDGGLVARSREVRRACLYRLCRAEDGRGVAPERLLTLAGHRATRDWIAAFLGRDERRAGATRAPAITPEVGATWPKVS